MARPEIKDDRREQILDAFELCVARYGLEGATLGKTAEFAGLARPLIRHNVGNREDLQKALVERFLVRSRVAMEQLLASLPDIDRLETLLDVLFDRRNANPQLVLVFNALSAAAPDNAGLAAQLQQWLADFVEQLEAEIIRAYPETSASQVEAAAAGISGIYFNVEALYPIGISNHFVTSSRRAAGLLVSALETGNE
ncbi:TetR/AcrR family transcriptional regulator [Roseibium sp. HPY-6]|uniref:TetR/AcrR family transcriptional regulator n=1 Tax=Roseibium sp. HPY-6 TaxID=3229852 RepID=UPI003390677D